MKLTVSCPPWILSLFVIVYLGFSVFGCSEDLGAGYITSHRCMDNTNCPDQFECIDDDHLDALATELL